MSAVISQASNYKKKMSSHVKVVHITTVDMSLRYLLLNQLKSLQSTGYEVTTISTAGENVPSIEAANIAHIDVPMTRNFTPLADIVSLWHLYRIMRQEQFTIVHTHNPKPGLLGQLAARLAGVPIVINTLHGFYFHDHMAHKKRNFYILIEKIAALCSDSILSQNPEDIQTAINEKICKPEKIKLLGNGIDIHRFDPNRINSKTKKETGKALGLDLSKPIVGFVGRLVAEKGILELLQAAPQIRQQVPSVQFLFIGPIDSEKQDALTPAVAADYGIDDCSFFTGMRQDMPELFSLMDVFVLPSHREGFPRSPMEASAMGVPCVVTNIRGCRQVVTHGENGLLIPIGDTEALADAILSLLTDKEKAQQMSEMGRKVAVAQFDEQQVFEKVKSEYRNLLKEKRMVMPTQIEHEIQSDE